MTIKLHPNLVQKDFIIDLLLCRVLLEDESQYPWIFLVPLRENVSKIMDLDHNDQLLLLKEMDIAQNILWKTFKLDQLNVAAIGNKTPQLHIHIIGRHVNDPAWPNTVWNHSARLPYHTEGKEIIINKLRLSFESNYNIINSVNNE